MDKRLDGGAAPASLYVFVIMLFFSALFGPNALITSSALLILSIGFFLLWRPSESPILIFIFAYQWIQISTPIFYANWLDVDLSEYSRLGGDINLAAVVSLFGLAFMGVGIRLGAGRYDPTDGKYAQIVARRHPKAYFFKIYVIVFIISSLAEFLSARVASIAQPLFVISNLKWGFFLILTYVCFLDRKGSRVYWIVAFAINLISSLSGYFSNFKVVFFFSIFGLLATQARLAPRARLGLALFGVILLVFGIAWSAIKSEYRSYISGGQSAQVVTVSFMDQLSKLEELASNLDGPALSNGLDMMIRRIGYIEFFGLVLNYVPSALPHEGGAIWFDAITRPVTPRVLFPDKSEINDSERTRKYSGLHVAGTESGTSISIGYMAETYIDFGYILMMPILAAFGYFIGKSYRALITAPASRGLLGMGLSSSALIGAASFETSITKMLGGIILSLVISYLVARFLVPRWFPELRA